VPQPGGAQQGEGAGQAPSPGQPGVAESPPQLAADRPSFEEVDRNADGFIGRTELAMVEGVDFAELDTDQDGRIGRQEWESSPTRQ